MHDFTAQQQSLYTHTGLALPMGTEDRNYTMVLYISPLPCFVLIQEQ